MGITPHPSTERPSRHPRIGFRALAAATIFVVSAAGALVWSTIETASAGFSGTTSNDGSLFEAAAIDLVLGPTSGATTAGLLIESDGVYPGLLVERCILVTYHGGLDSVDVRLSGAVEDGTGLETYLHTEIEIGSGASPTCDDFVHASTAYSGVLREFGREHGTFEEGLDLMTGAVDGDFVSMRLAFEVADDDRAQGLTSRFWFTVGAKP